MRRQDESSSRKASHREVMAKRSSLSSQHPWITQKPKNKGITGGVKTETSGSLNVSRSATRNSGPSVSDIQKIDKLKMLQERRNQYFQNKQTEELYQSEKQQFFSHQNIPSAPPKLTQQSSKVTNPPTTGHLDPHTDQLLQQLTYKLTNHIQENLKKQHLNSELQQSEVCDTILSRIDDFVSRELSSFCCPICYEIMAPPNRLPMLLFPCGHTFCQLCLEQHIQRRGVSASTMASSGGGRSCPYCREAIESRAINQSLKELVDQFLAQKGKIENRKGNMEDIFVSQRKISSTGSSSSFKETSVTSSNNDQYTPSPNTSTKSHYQSQLQSYEMRYQILQNELNELKTENEIIDQRKLKIQFATNHLLDEKKKVGDKIQMLLEEQALIEQHLQSQRSKMQEVQDQERLSKEKTDLIGNTLSNILREMDKLKVLAQAAEFK